MWDLTETFNCVMNPKDDIIVSKPLNFFVYRRTSLLDVYCCPFLILYRCPFVLASREFYRTNNPSSKRMLFKKPQHMTPSLVLVLSVKKKRFLMLMKISGEWKETVSSIFKRATHLWHLPGYSARDSYATSPNPK